MGIHGSPPHVPADSATNATIDLNLESDAIAVVESSHDKGIIGFITQGADRGTCPLSCGPQ